MKSPTLAFDVLTHVHAPIPVGFVFSVSTPGKK